MADDLTLSEGKKKHKKYKKHQDEKDDQVDETVVLSPHKSPASDLKRKLTDPSEDEVANVDTKTPNKRARNWTDDQIQDLTLSMSEGKKKHKKSKKHQDENDDQVDETVVLSPHKSPAANLKRKLTDPSENEVANVDTKTPNKRARNWTHDEELAMLDKIQEHVVEEEKAKGPKKTIYVKSINWEKVKVEGFSTVEIQAKFNTMSSRVRKMRTAFEIIMDMKKLPERTRGRNKTKPVVDPNFPKKPLTSYFRYVRANREKIVRKYPNLSVLEVTAKLSKRWNKMSEEKKKKYVDKYHEENEEYQPKLIEYLKNHNPDVTPPKDAFELWAEDERTLILREHPDISEKKTKKKLKRRWQKVEETEKEKWEGKSKQELKKFRARINSAHKKKAKQTETDVTNNK